MSEIISTNHKSILELLKQVDDAVHAVATQYPREFKCHKGCSDCCYAAFDITLAEGVLILHHFHQLGRKTRRQVLKKAKKAERQWQAAMAKNKDLSLVRIACPLLSPDDQCLLYNVRPVNCRTYGAPTEIHGKGHVCALSGFAPGKTYPTVRLQLIQNRLLELSMDIDPKIAMQRWPVASILLGALNGHQPLTEVSA